MKGGEPFIFAILFNILNDLILLYLYTCSADYYTNPVTKDKIIEGAVHKIVNVHALPKSTKKFAKKLASKGAISRKDRSR